MSCWIKYDRLTTTGFNWLLSNGSTGGANSQFNTRLVGGIYGGGWFNYFNGGSNYTGITGLGDGQWHHIAQTINYSTGDVKYYKDGVASSTVNTWGSTYATAKIATISTSFYPFNGDISNLVIFSSALSTANIVTLYNNGTPEVTPSFSPTSWWKLDNTTTGIQDSGSASNNGTNNGATETQTNVWTPRLNGESTTLPSTALVSSDLQFESPYSNFSLDFDSASSDYINCTDNDIFSFGNGTTDSPFSVSFWYNPTTIPANFGIIAKDNDASNREWTIGQFASNNKIRFLLKNNGGSNQQSIDSTTTLSTGQWYHITCTYNGIGGNNAADGMTIYINGVSETPTNITKQTYTAMANTTAPLTIGTYQLGGTPLYTDGKIDEVSIFNKALNQAEITSIYNNGYPKDITALAPISWWRLGEDAYFDGADFTIPNQITGAPNGTSANMTQANLVADAPGSYASGVGSSLALADRVGDAPESTANSLSINMIPSNRVSYPAGYAPTQVDNVYSMNFDGTSDYVDLTNQFSFVHNTKIFSISLWVKMDSYNATVSSVLVGNNYTGSNIGFQFWIDNRQNGTTRTNALKFNLWDGTNTAELAQDSVVLDNNWNNYVVTGDGTTLKYYKNGVQLTDTDSLPVATSTTAFANTIVGANTASPKSSHLDGKLDEIAIFDYALSARQIKQDIYNGTTTGKTADLNNISNLTAPVAWYRMGD